MTNIFMKVMKKYRAKKENLNKKIEKYYEDLNVLSKHYISYDEYSDLKDKYKNLYNESNNKKFKKNYESLNIIVKQYNNNFIISEKNKYKNYFDQLLEYPLDEEQRTVIVTNDTNTLVIAGAGSGKTSTMIGKVKYLIEKKNVKPQNIVVISFTNQAVNNFKEKLQIKDVRCTTFHKLGLDILINDKKPDIASNLLKKTIDKYLNQNIMNNNKIVNDFVEFMSLYFHFPIISEKSLGEKIDFEKGYDLESLKSKVLKQKNNLTTLNIDIVKSSEELSIANYLYLNGINYSYEPHYEYDVSDKDHRQYHPDFYLTDEHIYLEHFGINKFGRAPQYKPLEEQKYLNGIEFKRKIHKKNKTKLIETYSYYFKDNTIYEQLEKILKKNGVKFHPLDRNKIYQTLINQKNNAEIESLKKLIEKFINLYKQNNYKPSMFDDFIVDAKEQNNRRNILLLSIIKEIYLEYEKQLKINNQIDFSDMINLATEKVKQNKFNETIDYIIIDEFQDISFSRYLLIKEIQRKCNSKVICVGDDWQSIFRFSGSELDMFLHFDTYFKHPRILKINSTYRNSQQLIDIVGKFIMKNNEQIKKQLISNKQIDNPITIYYYDNNIYEITKEAINDLKRSGCNEVAIIGRNNFDGTPYTNKIINGTCDLSREFNSNVTFITTHSSKGLEYDGTIICNLKNSITGFPSKMSDDYILNYVSLNKSNYLFDEERRLFYVVLTRTKSRCILLVPNNSHSIFIDELLEIGGNKIEIINKEDKLLINHPNCPKCQTGKLSIKNDKNNKSFVGCNHYPKCDFRSNEIDIIKNPIICPNCGSYLVKRNSKKGYFYGCINYPYCKYTDNYK